MKAVLIMTEMLCTISDLLGAVGQTASPGPSEAEYYVTAYAHHYRVPIALVRAIVVRESNWQSCVISPKGAVGLMQLMPAIGKRLGVHRPLQCRPKRLRWRALSRLADATVS